jgi:hypothetical protein
LERRRRVPVTATRLTNPTNAAPGILVKKPTTVHSVEIEVVDFSTFSRVTD